MIDPDLKNKLKRIAETDERLLQQPPPGMIPERLSPDEAKAVLLEVSSLKNEITLLKREYRNLNDYIAGCLV